MKHETVTCCGKPRDTLFCGGCGTPIWPYIAEPSVPTEFEFVEWEPVPASANRDYVHVELHRHKAKLYSSDRGLGIGIEANAFDASTADKPFLGNISLNIFPRDNRLVIQTTQWTHNKQPNGTYHVVLNEFVAWDFDDERRESESEAAATKHADSVPKGSLRETWEAFAEEYKAELQSLWSGEGG